MIFLSIESNISPIPLNFYDAVKKGWNLASIFDSRRLQYQKGSNRSEIQNKPMQRRWWFDVRPSLWDYLAVISSSPSTLVPKLECLVNIQLPIPPHRLSKKKYIRFCPTGLYTELEILTYILRPSLCFYGVEISEIWPRFSITFQSLAFTNGSTHLKAKASRGRKGKERQ